MEKATSRELCGKCEGIGGASVSEWEPDGNPVQGNCYEAAGLRNRLVQEQDTTGRFGTTVDARRVEVVD